MTCYTSAAGQTSYDANHSGATILAPSTVASGSTFQIEMTPDPMNVPTSGGGYPIGYIANVSYGFVIPAGTSFVSASVSGGSNIGTGTPTVAQSGGKVVLSVPGTLAPGSTANFPKITATFQANGPAGSTIETEYAGTSYNDAALDLPDQGERHPAPGIGDVHVELLRPDQPGPQHDRRRLSGGAAGVAAPAPAATGWPR